MSDTLTKFWPQSLFARLLWVWLMGLALVLAAAAWLALDERMVRGQAVFHAKVTQDLAASADWLDTLTPEQRERWVDLPLPHWLLPRCTLPRLPQPSGAANWYR